MPASGSYDQEVRWNPILRKFVPSHITAEEHTIGPIDGLTGVYGIKLIEFPLNTTDPSTATISNPPIAISGYVMTSGTPGPGEFYPDFYETDGAVPHRSSYLIFDSSEDGETVTVDYWGGGGAGTIVNIRSFILAAVQNSVNALVSIRPRVEVITTTGASTWTKPATILPGSAVEIETIGGGGGGGGGNGTDIGAGGGGGGGRSRATVLESSLGSTESCNVGVGGAGGSAGNAGTTGGTTNFGTHASATGGLGGHRGGLQDRTKGLSGVGSLGSINDGLGDADLGVYQSSWGGGRGGGPGGQGGEGGAASTTTAYAGKDGKGYGGGGGGGGSVNGGTGAAGGTGYQGIITLRYWTIEAAE